MLTLFLNHQIEEVESVEEPEEDVVVEEEQTTLGEVTFIATIVIKMVTLKAIVLRRKETPLKKILVNMKLKNIKLCFSHVTILMKKMILYGI